MVFYTPNLFSALLSGSCTSMVVTGIPEFTENPINVSTAVTAVIACSNRKSPTMSCLQTTRLGPWSVPCKTPWRHTASHYQYFSLYIDNIYINNWPYNSQTVCVGFISKLGCSAFDHKLFSVSTIVINVDFDNLLNNQPKRRYLSTAPLLLSTRSINKVTSYIFMAIWNASFVRSSV